MTDVTHFLYLSLYVKKIIYIYIYIRGNQKGGKIHHIRRRCVTHYIYSY
nr:MAG TPA: hypothetical protein [Bacteriophage sp.]